MDPASILAHVTLNETLPRPQHPDPARRRQERNNTFFLRLRAYNTQIQITSQYLPREGSEVRKQQSIEPPQHRQHAFLRPRNPHLHPHRPLLSIRPRLPSFSAYRFREMGAKEEVSI
jgi:hypothetical protein